MISRISNWLREHPNVQNTVGAIGVIAGLANGVAADVKIIIDNDSANNPAITKEINSAEISGWASENNATVPDQHKAQVEPLDPEQVVKENEKKENEKQSDEGEENLEHLNEALENADRVKDRVKEGFENNASFTVNARRIDNTNDHDFPMVTGEGSSRIAEHAATTEPAPSAEPVPAKDNKEEQHK